MEPARAAQALASASASLTRPHDVAGALVGLLANCREGLNVDAAGILVHTGQHMELLAASSHGAAELEMHQLHAEEGPCFDAFSASASIQEHTPAALLERWPDFASTMVAAGFASVHATPLVWHGTAFGAIGLFRRSDEPFTTDEDRVARAFADIATMLVVQLGKVDAEQVSQRVREALDARIQVEQAKGVLADAQDLSMADAYEALVRGAQEAGTTLTGWAADVLERTQNR